VSLRHLYKEVIAWLRTQGVEPVATAGRVEGDAGAHGQPAQNPVTRTLLTLDKLRKLLSGELDPRPLTGGIKDFTNTVPASYDALEDLKLIEPMMKRLAERAAQTQAARQVTAGGLQGTDAAAQHKLSLSKKLGQQLGEEVVRMMLDNLMQDQRLLADVRQSLKAMEPILIRLSQADPRFFSDRQHPARLFLDKITNRSLAFSSDQEPGFARFYKALQNSVSVLAGGVGDAAAFARLLRKLEDAWAAEEHDQRARAEEAARGLLHAEQRNLLAQRLAQEFAEKMQGKSVPEIVQNFLSGPWAQVVAQAQLDRADGSADAEGYRGLVDDLIWSVQMRLVRRNRARLVEIVPGMLVRMRQGLALISYPPERMALFFDQLISLHEQAFEAGRTTEDAPTPPGGVKAPVAADTFWLGASEAADSGFLDEAAPLGAPGLAGPKQPEPDQPQTWTPDNLASGSWVDLALGREWVRAQLTWASPQRTLFMFISGKGLAHSMSRRTMDRLRGLGLIRLVSDGRVIDNALDAVAQAALRNDLDKTIGSG
ncbi:MAG: DUF1631 family protein, partial [Rhodoferax sp.]